MVAPWPLFFVAHGHSSSSSSKQSEGEAKEVQMTGAMDFTNILPSECLARIFQSLGAVDRNNCSLVCKRWHDADAQTRDCLALRAGADPSSLLLRFRFLTSVSLKGSHKAPAQLGDETLLLIAQNCRRLSRLKLKSCRALTDQGLLEFAQSATCLRAFSCSSCGFGTPGLSAVLQYCGELEDLSVKRLRRLFENPEPLLSPQASNLRRLCLKSQPNVQLFTTLLLASKHLQTLVLARNPGHDSDLLMETIAKHLPELTELQLESLQLSDRGLRAMSNCASLEILYLIKASDCSNSGLGLVVSRCRKLRKLHVDDRRSGRIGDSGLLAVANYCTVLQELVLIGVRVTVASLGAIASNCTVLERMALCNSEAVGDAELCCIAEKCHSLRKLCIKNCPISDQGLESFANGCPNLSKVKVKKCRNVTGSTVALLQMSRASLVISLDILNEIVEEEIPQREARVITSSTSILCSSSHFLKNRMSLAAESFVRRFCRSS